MPEVERFTAGDEVIALVVRGSLPTETTFVTPNEANLQVGYVVKTAGMDVPRHDHFPIGREIEGTAEVLVVVKGRAEMDLYDAARNHIATTAIGTGEIVVLLAGGHGFRFEEDTVLLEIKQGPYPGIDEKERF
jgi:hypothetical protein